MFSQVPRCHGLRGSQKYTFTPVAAVSSARVIVIAERPAPQPYISVRRTIKPAADTKKDEADCEPFRCQDGTSARALSPSFERVVIAG